MKNSFLSLSVGMLAFLVALQVAASDESVNAYIAPLVKESMLLDVTQGQSSVIVGERGHILVSPDGQDFQQVSVPTTVTLTAVHAINNDYWAVGHDASILRSMGGTDNWEVTYQDIELDRPFLDVLFLDSAQGIAIGGYGLFYRSLDSGKTWQAELHASVLNAEDIEYLDSIKDDMEFYNEELSFILPHFNRLNQAGERLLLAGEAGLLAQSYDDGKNWERFDIDYQGSFFDFQALDENTLIAVGLRGNLFVKSDEDEFRALQTCVTTSLNSVINTTSGVFIVGNNGVVFSLDKQLINSEALGQANEEGCRTHKALTRINTDVSSSISNAIVFSDEVIAIAADGIQRVSLVK